MATKTTEKKTEIIIAPIKKAYMTVRIVGDSPLLLSNWTTKAKDEIRDKTAGKKVPKVARNIWAEFAQRHYWMDGEPDVAYSEWSQEVYEKYAQGARFGFKAGAVKEAAVSAALAAKYIKGKKELDFLILGEGRDQLVQIMSDCLPDMAEDPIRLAGIGRPADLRYRPLFENWYADLLIEYDTEGNISAESIVNLINRAGAKIGIGEWRPEKSGTYGTFHVESVK